MSISVLFWLFIVLLLIVALSGWLYVWLAHMNSEDAYNKRTHTLQADHGLEIAKTGKLAHYAESLQQDLHIANQRIKQLEAMARIPVKRMPTGSLVQSFNTKKEFEKTDPTPTGILPTTHTTHLVEHVSEDDLPPMQIL
jgi:hypothetical protein